MKAIETTATIDQSKRLCLDKELPVKPSDKVKVIVLLPESQDDIEEALWLKAANSSPSFDFLNDPAEDIYSSDDGKAFQDEV